MVLFLLYCIARIIIIFYENHIACTWTTLTSQINVVLRLVFLRFCVSLRSLIQGTTFSFLPLLHNPSFICSIGVDAKDYSCYLVCYMDIFYIKVYVKRAAESDFGIQIDIE